MVRAGVHSFFRMSRQMAPVYELIFGCQILVSNFIFGGLNGYSDGIMMSTMNVPPSYGVSFYGIIQKFLLVAHMYRKQGYLTRIDYLVNEK